MIAWSAVAAAAIGCALLVWRGPDPLGRLRQPRPAWQVPQILRPVPGALPWPPRAGVGIAAGVGTLAWTQGFGWPALLAGAIVALGTTVALGRLAPADQARRHAQVVAGLPQVCDLLAVCLESGQPLRSATEVLAGLLDGPLGENLQAVTARVRLGVPEGDAWRELSAQAGLETLGLEVGRTVGSGMAVAQVLRGLATDARREACAAAEVRAKRVGVRSVLPLMICFLPAFVLLGVVPIIGGIIQNLFR